MAVELALDYVERNDNKVLTLTDISTGWSTPAGVDIASLTLSITITKSDKIEIAYDTINLMTFSNPIIPNTTQAELVFMLDTSDLKVSGAPLGTSDSVFPDGLYRFRYVLNNGLPIASILDEYVLVEGNVRNLVYKAMREIPTDYACDVNGYPDKTLNAVFGYAYLNSMRAGGYVAKTEELLDQLFVLERLLEYGGS